ncbi:MAG: hypothetical protein JXR48_11750 [Candidatus Delongbacteria bacterium]|nr:hypothetical protein [Candidatus Delongbacteria bacterium]MBN2835625.1 hypothetical protein [Candidatus Delongbacteria bacterium]
MSFKLSGHILILIFISYLPLVSLPLTNLLYEENRIGVFRNTNNNFISISDNYRNLYSYKDEKGVKQYIYQNNFIFEQSCELFDITFRSYYRYVDDKIYFNSLDNIPDYLSFSKNDNIFFLSGVKNIPSINLKIGSAIKYNTLITGSIGFMYMPEDNYILFNSALDENRYSLRYNIKGFTENLDFNYFSLSNSFEIEYDDLALELTYIYDFPIEDHGKFENRISGFGFSSSTKYSFYDKSTSVFNLHYHRVDGDLDCQGDQYGKIDGFQYMKYDAQHEIEFVPKQFLNFGIDGVFTWIGEDSFIDIWPFTFWDLFLCSRTRLKEFETNIILPNLSYSFKPEYKLFNATLTHDFFIKYSHLIFENRNLYKERYFILYPIIVDYKKRELDISSKYDGLFFLKIDTSINISNYEVNLYISQYLPFKYSYITDVFDKNPFNSGNNSGSSISKTIRGGTELAIKIYYKL